MNTGFLDQSELATLGLASVGDGVLIDSTVRFYGADRISIGSQSRVDAYSVISAGDGGIAIGSHVHIAAHCFVAGTARIEIADFAGLSGRCSVYSSTDDFSGHFLTGPTVAEELRSVDSRPVRIGRHVVLGVGSVVLPGVEVGDCAAVGALSLVKGDVDPYAIVAGMRGEVIGRRDTRLGDLEERV